MSIPWRDFNSSYAIRSRFYLKLTMVNLNESRKDRELEGSNQHHAKALGERPTSGAGRPRVGRPACTCGQISWNFCRRAGLVYTVPEKLPWSIWWRMLAGRPEFPSEFIRISLERWFRPPRLNSLRTQRKIKAGVWLAHTCAPTTRAQGGITFFYSKQSGVLLHTTEWTKQMK